MGGERISIGSDSHTLDTVARGVDDCVKTHSTQALPVTVFRERKPVQSHWNKWRAETTCF
ncbi:MAG: hypothetical protein ACLT4C_01755 [Butyricicoccus sp.]